MVSGVNSRILGPGLSLKSQPWNLGPGTWFQASNQESWVRELFSRFNSGILGPATRFQESTLESSVRAPAFRVNSGIFGSGPVFKTQLWNLGSGHPFSEVSSGISVFGPGLPFRSRHRFEKSTLESWIGAPVFRSQLWNFWSGTCFQEPTLVSWVWAPVSGSDSGFQESAAGILVGGTCFQESTLESWARGPDVVGSQLWDLGLKPFFGVGNLLSGAGSGGSGIIGWNLGPCVGPAVFSRLGSLVFRSQRHLFPMESLLRHLF